MKIYILWNKYSLERERVALCGCRGRLEKGDMGVEEGASKRWNNKGGKR
jgi:hypothetical protein